MSSSSQEHWESFGRSGRRIWQVIGSYQVLETTQYYAWKQYLENQLRFPFKADVYYVDEIDEYELLVELPRIEAFETVTVTGIGQWVEPWGLMADIKWQGRKYTFPLCDLIGPLLTKNRRHLNDYQLWYLER